MPARKSVLAIVRSQNVFGSLAAILGRRTLEVHRARGLAAGLLLSRNISYDLIILELASDRMGPLDIFEQLDDPDLASYRAPVLALTDACDLLEKFSGPGKIRALPPAASPEIEVLLAHFLMVESRLAKRLLVELQVWLDGSQVRKTCQTENISETGMFLRTTSRPPVGSDLEVTLQLPDLLEALSARVRVVRHALCPPEPHGIGVQLVQMKAHARSRYDAFLRAEMASDSQHRSPRRRNKRRQA